jgi:ribosomal-protein-alanine N-acetyltransferase
VAIWLPKPLKTARLRLRATRRGDEDWIIGLFTDAEVRKYVGGAMSLEDARASVVLSSEWWGHFAILGRESEQAIGSLSFSHRHGPWEINYALQRDSWGHGLASEAIEAALRWFFSETDEQQVSAITQTANARSCRLLEKLGASLTESSAYRGEPVNRYTFQRSQWVKL